MITVPTEPTAAAAATDPVRRLCEEGVPVRLDGISRERVTSGDPAPGSSRPGASSA